MVGDGLGELTRDPEVWRALSQRYGIDLSCGFMKQETNGGLEILSSTLGALGFRRIKWGPCPYAPPGYQGAAPGRFLSPSSLSPSSTA